MRLTVAKLLLVLLALFTPASRALAAPVPGASYHGVAADYAIVNFTVSSDGTSITSYSITNVRGNTCTFNGNGVAGSWAGTPIVGNAFDYQLGASLTFQGSFPGAQSASGTFAFQNAAVPSAYVKACDSGTVRWTATTTATPPSGGGTGTGKPGPTKIPTHVSFRALSRTTLGGRIASTRRVCLAGRTLTLWRGRTRIARTRTTANGTYAFRRSTKLHGHSVHVDVAARTVAGTLCEAVASRTVRA